MTSQSFFNTLIIVSAATAGVLGLLHLLLPPFRVHWSLSVSSVIIFIALSIGMFYAGKSTASSTNRMAFNGLVSGSVFGKMVLAIAVLFIYREICLPPNQWFVGIFLFVYVIYTVFEVWFLTRIVKK